MHSDDDRKFFEYALRNPKTTPFNKMLFECLENEGYITGFRISSSEFINARINYYF
jgi:hypothetical protein